MFYTSQVLFRAAFCEIFRIAGDEKISTSGLRMMESSPQATAFYGLHVSLRGHDAIVYKIPKGTHQFFESFKVKLYKIIRCWVPNGVVLLQFWKTAL